jgi:formylglycine-generating enzyme required for sulfatase activity
MVFVPGGPVALTNADYAEFAVVYSGRPVACMPDFWIDRLEVTNGEYREFLIATKYPRLPDGWMKSELTQPTWDASYPVNGLLI